MPGRTEDGYADRSDRLILSGYVYTDQTDVSVRWRFGFQEISAAERTVYAGRWTYFEIPISKEATMGSDLHFSFSAPGIFYFSQLMLRQDGTSGIYTAEAAPRAAPLRPLMCWEVCWESFTAVSSRYAKGIIFSVGIQKMTAAEVMWRNLHWLQAVNGLCMRSGRRNRR